VVVAAAVVVGVVVVAVVSVVVAVIGTISYNNLSELTAFNYEHV